MKSLKDHGLEYDDWINIHSEICSVAETLRHLESGYEVKSRLWELSASYYNQWRFVLDSYQKLYDIFSELNIKSTKWNSEIISDFTIYLLKHESDIKNFSYLFIISLKSLLDLLICIVDLIQNREIREEHKLPDFFNYYKKNIKFDIPELKYYLFSIRTEKDWIVNVKSVRDRIVHRGYLLKPDIGFSKIENLIIKTYKGADFYSDVIEVDIGNTLGDFLKDIKDIEGDISKILLTNIEDLKEAGLTHKSKFRFAELVNEYSSEQI